MPFSFSRWSIIGASCLSLIGAPATAAALPSVGSWTVNYNETQCTAERKFADGDRELTFALSPAIDGSSYEVTFSDPGGASRFFEQITGKAEFGERAAKFYTLTYRDPATNRQIYRFRVPAGLVAQSGENGEVSFRAGSYRAQLRATNLAGAVGALDTCLKDLRAYWNAVLPAGARSASPQHDVEAVLKPVNHDQSGIWVGVKGSARYMLFIDPAGKLAGCDAVSDDASPILGILGCDILRERVQFAPALDKDSKPVRNVILTPQVRWKFG